MAHNDKHKDGDEPYKDPRSPAGRWLDGARDFVDRKRKEVVTDFYDSVQRRAREKRQRGNR